MTKKDKKQEDWDDGRTIAPMNGDELPAYRKAGFANRENRKEAAKKEQIEVTKEEERAMRKAMFAVMLPRVIAALVGFGIVWLLMALWLG